MINFSWCVFPLTATDNKLNLFNQYVPGGFGLAGANRPDKIHTELKADFTRSLQVSSCGTS